MQTMFLELSLNIVVKSKNLATCECSSYAVSTIPADSILMKRCFFVSVWYREFAAKNVGIKVTEKKTAI